MRARAPLVTEEIARSCCNAAGLDRIHLYMGEWKPDCWFIPVMGPLGSKQMQWDSWRGVARRMPVTVLAMAFWTGLAAAASPDIAVAPRPACESELCAMVSAGHLADLRWPDFTRQQEQVTEFYQARSYELAWVRDGVATERARELARVLREAGDKGLDMDDYDGRRWSTRILELDQYQMPAEGLERFDLAFTVAVTRYVSDLRDGRANPGIYGSDPDRKPLWNEVRSLLDAPDLSAANAVLDELEPPFAEYRATLEALKQYRTLAEVDDGALLPEAAKTVDPGQEYVGVPRLIRLLRLLGDLPEDAAVTDDVTSGEVVSAGVYEGALVDAVKHYQARHGLEPDGRIGKTTLAALNTPLTGRVRELELAAERWRWLPHGYTPSIMVNIPEFRLRALDASHRVELEMNVVTGGARNTQTPLLGEDLKYIIWRPYWNVPYSIQRKELVPDLQKDPDYLAKHAYEVVTRTGELVSRGTVTPALLEQIKHGQVMVRQTPGPKNSLGLVKFMFPNQESVYMHDTPSKSLFSRARRDFSHGCVRVADPPALAAWALRSDASWTPERIAAAMQGPDDKQVNLKQAIPVRIVYLTAWADNGQVRFFDDIYGLDQQLTEQLAARYD